MSWWKKALRIGLKSVPGGSVADEFIPEDKKKSVSKTKNQLLKVLEKQTNILEGIHREIKLLRKTMRK